MSSTPEPIDDTTARELALAALREITPATTVGEYRDSTVDADGVVTLRFDNRMPGYPGWYWTVSPSPRSRTPRRPCSRPSSCPATAR